MSDVIMSALPFNTPISGLWSKQGLSIVSACLAVQVGLQIRKYVKRFGAVGWPDHYVLFAPLTLLSLLAEWGLNFQWEKRFRLYPKSGKEVITIMPILWGEPMILTNSIEVIKQGGGNGSVGAWFKPRWVSASSLYWGRNLLAANDIEWRTYRKILQPAFNTKTYEYVWQETARLYDEMIQSENWPEASSTSGKSISIQVVQDITTRIALSMILSVGFGLPLSWKDTSRDQASGGKMSLSDGVKHQADNVVIVAEAPWLLDLPIKRFKKAKEGLDALRTWFKEAIVERRSKIALAVDEAGDEDDVDKSVQRDILSRLILTSLTDKKVQLDDDQIIGNTWVMLFAGHETTASTLAATLAYLAAHPKEQAIIYDEIQSVIRNSGSKDLTFEDYDSLVKVRAAFIEALRMIPAGSLLIREAAEDTVVRTSYPDGKGGYVERSVPISKGTTSLGDMVGVQYNPRYFPEPEIFRPSRWYDATSDDAYTAFSGGPRTCIGRKFALTEAVCWLSHVLRDWEVTPLMKEGENIEEWKGRVMQAKLALSLAMHDAPLVFKRR